MPKRIRTPERALRQFRVRTTQGGTIQQGIGWMQVDPTTGALCETKSSRDWYFRNIDRTSPGR